MSGSFRVSGRTQTRRRARVYVGGGNPPAPIQGLPGRECASLRTHEVKRRQQPRRRDEVGPQPAPRCHRLARPRRRLPSQVAQLQETRDLREHHQRDVQVGRHRHERPDDPRAARGRVGRFLFRFAVVTGVAVTRGTRRPSSCVDLSLPDSGPSPACR